MQLLPRVASLMVALTLVVVSPAIIHTAQAQKSTKLDDPTIVAIFDAVCEVVRKF